MERRIINFRGTCSARSTLVLSSPRLPRPFRTAELHFHFPPGCQGLLSLEPYVSPDDVCPTTGPPAGLPLLSGLAQDTRFRGDAEDLSLAHELPVTESGYCLKLYCVNDDWYDHHVDAQILIDLAD